MPSKNYFAYYSITVMFIYGTHIWPNQIKADCVRFDRIMKFPFGLGFFGAQTLQLIAITVAAINNLFINTLSVDFDRSFSSFFLLRSIKR